MNDKQILQKVRARVATTIEDEVYGYFDKNDKKIATSIAVRKIMEHANEHHQFWELIDSSYFEASEFEYKCKEEKPTLKKAIREATDALEWNMLDIV